MSQSLKAFHSAWLRFITKRHFRLSSLFSTDFLKCYGVLILVLVIYHMILVLIIKDIPNLWFTLSFWSTCKPIWLLCKILHQGFFLFVHKIFLLSWDKELDLNKRPGTKLWSCLTVYLYTVYHQGLNLKVSRLDKNLCKTLSYLQCPWILQMFECGDFYKNNYLNGGNAYILDKSRLGFEWIYEKAWRAVLNREREKRERENYAESS